MSVTRNEQRRGFTIVELLIVIVVIAILAAISIVAYNGIQDRAIDSTVKSDLANFAKKIELAKIDNGDKYPAVPLNTIGISASKQSYQESRNNWYYCRTPDYEEYALGVVSKKQKGYFMSSSDGLNENVDVSWSSTCLKLGPTGTAASAGYNWNGTAGSWASWVN